jgi:predicted acetyltransferase
LFLGNFLLNIDIIRVERIEEGTFRNLFQFYQYELSRYTGWQVNTAGQFQEDALDGCWTNPQRYPLLIKFDNHLAGLALVDRRDKGRYADQPYVAEMSAFFILAAYQTRGIGTAAATTILNMFPGNWEIYQMQKHDLAKRFWRKVIKKYTKQQYREIISEEYHGVIQFFNNADYAQPPQSPLVR